MIPLGTSRSDTPPEGIPADVWALAREAYEQRPIRTEGIARAILADRAGRPNVGGLTPRQSDCLRFVHDYQIRFGGVSPTYDEIAAHLGCGKSAVAKAIDQLEERGRIKRLPNRSRAITIIANPPTGA